MKVLDFQNHIIQRLSAKNGGLIITGRGMDTLNIVQYLVLESCKKKELVFVFGLNDKEKHKIIWEAANEDIEFLPKDIEKDTGRKERMQQYESRNVFFHNPGILSKDFLTSTIDPMNISGFIIYGAEIIHKDPGLQMAVAYLKSRNPTAYIKAFSESIFKMSDLRLCADLLWIRFFLLYPRYEESVKKSIREPEVQIINISLKTKKTSSSQASNSFEPIVQDELMTSFELLSSILKSLTSERGMGMKLSYAESLSLPKKVIVNKAKNEDHALTIESVLFLRSAIFFLLHSDPLSFQQFMENNRPSPFRQPLWTNYPQVPSLYKVLPKLTLNSLPNPKLQYITHIISLLPNRNILILAEGACTVKYICSYLAEFRPRKGSKVEAPNSILLENDEEPLIDYEHFGLISTPSVMVMELHAQIDVLERFSPEIVVFWDITVLALRRLEFYCSKFNTILGSYFLVFQEALELESTKRVVENENNQFARCLNDLVSLSMSPLQSLPAPGRKIIVDDREFRSSLPNSLLHIGFTVIPGVLIVGDYVLTDEIVIERKAYQDLISSLKSGRLLSQIQRMSQYYKRPMIMLEFSESDPYNSISSKEFNFPIMTKLISITKLFPKVRFIWGRNALECAKTLWSIAEGEKEPNQEAAFSMGNNDHHDYMDIKSNVSKFLSSFSFLNSANMDEILVRCKTIRDVLAMKKEEMMSILPPSVGLKLYSLLHSAVKSRKSNNENA